ncbi:MAG TPA: MauE/DoxX family redox-associated membrane protein [Bryobacteraceae bacterium]|nr:MauE/DoxX family redox-associated membrane protein [Bryobacteraceae bacterium]
MQPLELPGWKTKLSWVAAVLLAVLFLVSGIWKITEAQAWAQRITELKVPASLSLVAALGFGIAETVGGVFILVPRFRRWGAVLLGILLLAFIGYFALNYPALRGADCSCFPWVKRMVGPGFFATDALMLGLAFLAGFWSKPVTNLRTMAVVAGAVVVFALVTYGVEAVRQEGTRAPSFIMVNGRPYSIQRGKYFLFFFNPGCMHCFDAARAMSQLHWGGTTVVAIPVEMPQFSGQFLEETGLRAVVSSDFDKLKNIFGYTAYPFGVAVENGRERAPVMQFENAEPGATLKRLGFVQE